MTQNEIYESTKKKLQILEKIAANTQTQLRFVHKLQMKGLQRMLKERAALIDELTTINKKLEAALDREISGEIIALLAAIKEKQSEIIKTGNQVLQDAVIEQNGIKAKLQRIRTGRNLQNGYIKRWGPLYGNRINAKG